MIQPPLGDICGHIYKTICPFPYNPKSGNYAIKTFVHT